MSASVWWKNPRSRWLPSALLAAALSGNAACSMEMTCTLRGCTNQATIRVQRADGRTPPLAVDLNVDGREVTCAAPLGSDFARGTCTDPLVFVQFLALFDCIENRTGGGVTRSCSANGNSEQVITFTGTPQAATVALRAGTEVVARGSFEFTYATVQPNGEQCGPACQQATQSWQLP